METHSSTLAWKIPWMEEPGRLQSMGSLESDTTEQLHFIFHFHALEKEMATHSSVLAWRTPRMGEPGGLPSMGSHRVRHDWSDLAAERPMGLVSPATRGRMRHHWPWSGMEEGLYQLVTTLSFDIGCPASRTIRNECLLFTHHPPPSPQFVGICYSSLKGLRHLSTDVSR